MSDDVEALPARLRSGDAEAFAEIVDMYGPSMLRVARDYVASREHAEDVVQETWVAVLRGIGRFEGRSSLRTWIFSILINIGKRQGVAERRYADTAGRMAAGGTVDPGRFREAGDAYPGHWKEAPAPFPETPEGSLLGHELLRVAGTGLDRLPERQREVVRMRDVLGFSAEEVCSILEISAANQRVLLHRGRATLRQELEDYLGSRP